MDLDSDDDLDIIPAADGRRFVEEDGSTPRSPSPETTAPGEGAADTHREVREYDPTDDEYVTRRELKESVALAVARALADNAAALARKAAEAAARSGAAGRLGARARWIEKDGVAGDD